MIYVFNLTSYYKKIKNNIYTIILKSWFGRLGNNIIHIAIAFKHNIKINVQHRFFDVSLIIVK